MFLNQIIITSNMALEEFFERGNKIAFFGSYFFSENAKDLDYTLFTHRSRHLSKISHTYLSEIADFAAQELGAASISLDFSGRMIFCENTYNIDGLPENDPLLDFIYLSGVFFPDRSFIDNHYRKLFGDNCLITPWVRYAEYVQRMPLAGVRESKRHYDIPLLLATAERLAEGNEGLREIVDRYKRSHNELCAAHTCNRVNQFQYLEKNTAMVESLIEEVRSVCL